jgi:nicotinate-nucleotide adenylyltransferase
MSDVEKIKSDLRSLLSEYRYLHSLRVAEVAKGLAACYSYDIEKAYATGLVHDIAKEFSDEENRDIVSKYHLPIELLNKNYRKMLHADIGAVIAKNVYGFDDEAEQV